MSLSTSLHADLPCFTFPFVFIVQPVRGLYLKYTVFFLTIHNEMVISFNDIPFHCVVISFKEP